MPPFTSMEQLRKYINNKAKKALDIISAKIEKQLRLNIERYTYGDTENAWYERTGEFLESFYAEKSQEIAGEIIGWVIHDPMVMSAPINRGDEAQETFRHGNALKGIDRREKLAEILNVSGVNGSFDWKGKERQPFFDITIQWLEQSFDKLVIDAFRQVGLTIRKSAAFKILSNLQLNEIF